MTEAGVSRLVVVSNRVGPLSDEGNAGGLAVGLADALRDRGGVWFGWSGKTSEEGTFGPLQIKTEGEVQLVTVDMTDADLNDFYSGYANQALWPVLHYRMDLAGFHRRFADAYWRMNQRMAGRLRPLLKPNDMVWVHDYHFVPFGEEMRATGFEGPLGYFLHIPFPPPEVITALPNAHRLVSSMLAYDVVGFQTETDRENFARFLVNELGGREEGGGWIEAAGRRLVAAAFPIGIDSERFARLASSAEAQRRTGQLRAELRDRKQIIGVDRLDYSKGIPERFRAFDRLLNDYPETRSNVTLLQVAPLSREKVKAYARLRRELEELAGHINGAHGQLDWTPVRILTRGFSRKSLAGLYRGSQVGLVTPLRDGMNLVAKEYVAAQDPSDPGVLILSRFAGAAHELKQALIVNPYDTAEVAEMIQRALQMPLAERIGRSEALNKVIRGNGARDWCANFLEALERVRGGTRTAATGSDGAMGAEVVQLPRRNAAGGRRRKA